MNNYTLILPHSLEPRRNEFENYIVKAMDYVRAFAAKYSWSSLVHESFFYKVGKENFVDMLTKPSRSSSFYP